MLLAMTEIKVDASAAVIMSVNNSLYVQVLKSIAMKSKK
jgi:hypothetical protein